MARFANRLDWKVRDNSILLDVGTFDFKIHNRTRGKLRLFLGEFEDDEFKPTVETIRQLDPMTDEQVREMVKFIITEVIKPSDKKTEDVDNLINQQYEF